MAAPNSATPFTTNVVAFFPGHEWRTDVVIEGYVTFYGRTQTIFTFVNFWHAILPSKKSHNQSVYALCGEDT